MGERVIRKMIGIVLRRAVGRAMGESVWENNWEVREECWRLRDRVMERMKG